MLLQVNEAAVAVNSVNVDAIVNDAEVTVGKHTPCKLSFVYTSYIRYCVRAVP